MLTTASLDVGGGSDSGIDDREGCKCSAKAVNPLYGRLVVLGGISFQLPRLLLPISRVATALDMPMWQKAPNLGTAKFTRGSCHRFVRSTGAATERVAEWTSVLGGKAE